MERPIAEIVQILEGPGRAATSTKSNDRFRVLLNNINVLENRAKARRRALLVVSYCSVTPPHATASLVLVVMRCFAYYHTR